MMMRYEEPEDGGDDKPGWWLSFGCLFAFIGGSLLAFYLALPYILSMIIQ